MNTESVGKKIVEALKKQAENIELEDTIDPSLFDEPVVEEKVEEDFALSEDLFAEPEKAPATPSFFDDVEEEKDPFFAESQAQTSIIDNPIEGFEIPANIAVLKRLISQLPSGVSRHTGAQIIKQTMEALGISMKSVLQDAQQVQESLKVSARECQGTIQEYKKQILTLEKQSQNYQKQYSALNDLISLFIQTTR
jgi:hypothetical protein